MPDRIKIIVAEDNPIQREYLAVLIRKLGYNPIPAEDGAEALRLLHSTNAQIIISDFEMPNLNGIELTREVRKLTLDHYVHIIMITGMNDDDFWREAMEAGADDFLSKSSSPAMLKARIRAATRLIHHAMELAAQTRALKDSHARINEDLLAAANAQRQLLPDQRNDFLGFKIASAFVPSSFVSGDMFGCFPVDERTLGIYTVDVSGHGVHASLLSVAIGHLITPEFFRTKAFTPDGHPDPAALVADLNQRFSGADNDDYFTMFTGVIDTQTGHLTYCQAGAPSPIYVDQAGKILCIGEGGFPVGMLPDLAFENAFLTIGTGGTLVLCSDAALEAENKQREAFGQDRLKGIVATKPQTGLTKLPDDIIMALSAWSGEKALEDDLTILALERT
ncbi:PP2C family protein-serine/threonine phosphatase [Pseudorhodobacter sp. W20_MBD10_FR17]|uniref:PP2C family protein-serine/threonine phosphatase n=1 Tax=Pseudorhodobacter sp. W20_MBD10_FR17 TaxID=3240266 RepID=UPI003F957E65